MMLSNKRILIGAMIAVAVAAGTAGAVTATGGGKAAEQEVLTDAAKRLGVTAEELRSALAAAQDKQLDEAVKAGRLTQQQADAIKEHREAEGTVLGFGHGGPGGFGGPPGGPGFHGPGGHGPVGFLIDDAAKALGITREELFEQLRAGKSPAEIATAAGKSLDEVKAAVKAAATKRLDDAVKAGRLTKAQRDEILEHLTEGIDRLGDEGLDHGFGGPHAFRGPHGP